MNWDAVTAVSTAISMLAFVATAIYVRGQLKHMEQDRYLAVTNQLFSIWEGPDFMDAQLWLLHRLEERTWGEFVSAHRADYGEAAFHRVGSFYDRLGTLIRLRLIDEEEMLSTMGPYAIAVWQKMEPLVRGAREIEHSLLFDDFERLIPACRHCYVPSLGAGGTVIPFSLLQPEDQISAVGVRALRDQGAPLVVVDLRPAPVSQSQPCPDLDVLVLPAAELEQRFREIPADREVVLFCDCPEDASSAQAAYFLRRHGYSARAVRGGFAALSAAAAEAARSEGGTGKGEMRTP